MRPIQPLARLQLSHTDPNGSRWIMRPIEDSLRRLQTNYIYLYQLHRPSLDTEVEERLVEQFDKFGVNFSYFNSSGHRLQ